MVRVALLSLATIFLIAGGLLTVFGLVTPLLNEHEWRTNSKTGLPLDRSEFTWSMWQPMTPAVHSIPYLPEEKLGVKFEYRVGHAPGTLFNFTAYEGRFYRDGVPHYFPAIGPGWGGAYRWIWALIALSLGACFLVPALLMKKHHRHWR